jgi:two-component system KDP operon response regulator KdpE
MSEQPPIAPARVLVIEDAAEIRRFLRVSLQAHGLRVAEARLGAQGLALCADEIPDLVVLDLGLPDMDGIGVIRRLRQWSQVPILVLSVRSTERAKVAALDAGANDYVTKPFGISELNARVRVVLRAARDTGMDARPVLAVGGLSVDRARHRVCVDARTVEVTPKEFELLALLAAQPGRVFTHRQILDHIWGEAHVEDVHYLRVLVRSLRRKLEDDAGAPRFVHTVQGVGYRLEDAREQD